MTTLTVGTGQNYASLAAAVAAAKPGDTIDLQPGTYTNDFPAQINGLTIEGVGGVAKLVATVAPPNGKAILDVAGNTTLRNLDISGVSVPDANGAAIRYENGNLLVQNTAIHGNQDGILAANDPTGSITIDGSEIYGNGTSTGSTHNIYIGDVGTFTLTNSYVHDANTGHEIKSRAETTVITNNRIEDGSGTASYEIDLPNGGNAVISGNTIQKSANSGNRVTIAYGEEGSLHAGTSVRIAGNVFVSDQARTYAVWDAGGVAIAASGNSTYNVDQIDKAGLLAGGFTALAARPTLGIASVIAAPVTAAPVITAPAAQAPAPTSLAPTSPTIDVTPPTLTLTESAAGNTRVPTNTISGTVSDSGVGVAVVEVFDTTRGRLVDLGSAALNNGVWSFTATRLADGTHAFSVVSTDRSGNGTALTSAGPALTVDTAPPVVTIGQSVSGVTAQTGNHLFGNVADAGVGVANVEIFDMAGGAPVSLGNARVGGAAWSFDAQNLAPGSHSFAAVATDYAGNGTCFTYAGAVQTVTL